VSPQNLNIDPLSGGYEKRKDEEIAHIPHQEYDEFFDSAPIPVHAFESIDQAAAPAPEKSDSTKRDH
jgi:hypothetical protein